MRFVKSSQTGFTLIELMITVVIMAILAAIAIPSYQAFVKKNAEEQAKESILNIASQLSSWRSKRLSYMGFVPRNQNCSVATEEYCYSTSTGDIYIPLGADATNYRFKINLLDNISNKPLNAANVEGRSWVMVAEPNPNHALLKNSPTFFMESTGKRCAYPKGEDCNSKQNITW